MSHGRWWDSHTFFFVCLFCSSVPDVFRHQWRHVEIPLQCMCVCACVCGPSTIRVTGWFGFYEVRGQQERGKSDLLTSGSNWGELSQPDTPHFYCLPSTWIYVVSSSLPLLLLLLLSFCCSVFLLLLFFSFFRQLVSHSHYITWQFQLSEGRNQIVLTSAEKPKGSSIFRSWKRSGGVVGLYIWATVRFSQRSNEWGHAYF